METISRLGTSVPVPPKPRSPRPGVVEADGSSKASSHGYVHSTLSGSAVDGPGMRNVIFLAGCSFRCLFCHNPDTWKAHVHQRRSLESLLEELSHYASFLRFAGGLTVSGGEPLGQAAFVGELFREVKKRWGLHTALDTQGYLSARLPDSWFDPVDLVLLDLKHSDDAAHRALTGYSLQPSLDFAQRLGRMNKPMWIRHVVVPGWTDRVEVADALAAFVETLPTVKRVELLPFHQLGAHKWKDLGLDYKLKDARPPAEELVEALRERFRRRGIETR